MKLYVKQKIFSWADTFSVYDGAENEVYLVKGALFSFGKKLTVYDTRGNELCRIEQEIFRFRPRYHVIKGDDIVATVVKEFSMFRPYYTVEGPEWEIEGDFFSHDYEITSGGRPIAAVQKQWFTWGDTYELCIDERTCDPITVMAIAIIIDCVLDSRDD